MKYKYLLVLFLLSITSACTLTQSDRLNYLSGNVVHVIGVMGTATAFYLGYNGHKYLMTNKHVCDIAPIFYLKGNQKFAFSIIKNSNTLLIDLCLASVAPDDKDVPEPLRLRYAEPAKYSHLSTLGFPLEYDLQIPGEGTLVGVPPSSKRIEILTTTTIFPGHSGSPVIDDSGMLVGVFNAYDPRTGYSFMVPLNVIKRFINLVDPSPLRTVAGE